MSDDWTGDGVAVPSGRWARAARMGGVGAGILGAMAGGGAKALLSGTRPDPRALLLTPGNARRLADGLAQMRGAAMKMGQLLSMEAGDVLPPELAAVLARLRDDAHVMPPAQLKQVLQAEYGRDFLRRFRRFDPRPVAAASIGQVHRAVAPDGRVLALKVQYPGVRAAIDADVDNLGSLLRVSGLLPKGVPLAPLLDEARRQLHEEADYAREAGELARFGGLIDDPGLTLPGVQRDFCTANILAMDFAESARIETVEEADQATRDAVATRLFALMLREVFDWRRVQTDPNFANYRWQPDTGRVVLLDFGAAREFPQAFVEGLRALLGHALAGDGDAVLGRLQDMRIVPGDAPEGQMRILRGMIALALETFSQDRIDFADTRFLSAMREAGMQLGMQENFRHIPPWDVLYLQRKLGGLVLLATRLRARVAMRDLAAPYANGSSG
jgi:predicted unusual protein kinase regulating ubiquinone biosynthesis (AarF/ABC1/UbiB family)